MRHSNAKWLLLVAVIAGVICAILFLRRTASPPEPHSGTTPDEQLIERGLMLLAEQEEKAAQQFWGQEYVAQDYGRVVDQFWNELNTSSNRLEVVGKLSGRLHLPTFREGEDLPHDIKLLSGTPNGPFLQGKEWQDWVSQQLTAGWHLERVEFRHNQFTPLEGTRARSVYYFSAHLTNPSIELTAILEGDLHLLWDAPEFRELAEVDASALELRMRPGTPPFHPVLNETLHPDEGFFIDPLVARDLDRDGQLEIVLAAKNRVYRRDREGDWTHTPLCTDRPRAVMTALIEDFDGDRQDDFLYATFDGLHLYSGDAKGEFSTARPAWNAKPRLKYGQVLTCGDIDLDGDLDLFLAQYKVPYDQGQMPVPYFDANDGHPAFLLVNDGKGNFIDATGLSGLASRRFRRSYSASLADVDEDRDLDLVVVSDFYGVDAWENDGSGKFKAATAKWYPNPLGLGMAHQFADFNTDGRLDFLMVGMNSPVVDRLTHLGLDRPYHLPDAGMRAKVTYGNRVWLSGDQSSPGSALADEISRTGWSWGATAGDFDNDGYPDLYIANGHETRKSVTDYEPQFWMHDIYLGTSQENRLLQAYFKEKFQQTRGKGQSYGGYEKNRLFLNRGGTNWVESAHLFGVALEEDSRNVLAEDLNGDGKLDLLVTTFEVWPEIKQTLQIFENRLPETGNWIALGGVPVGSRVVLESPSRVGQFVTGDSYRSQSSDRVHFGLGKNEQSVSATLIRPGGETKRMDGLEPGKVHYVD